MCYFNLVCSEMDVFSLVYNTRNTEYVRMLMHAYLINTI